MAGVTGQGSGVLRVVVGGEEDGDVRLGVCAPGETSCWAGVLEGACVPDDLALDVLAECMDGLGKTPEVVEVVGAPASSVLPVLWLRTIWCDAETVTRLLWREVVEPSSHGEVLGARACAAAVNDVVCGDPEAAASLWGIEVGGREPCADALFDAMQGLIDAWDLRVSGPPRREQWTGRMRDALDACADRGRTRVAIYGAGTHTRVVGEAFAQPPVEVVGVIDDDSRRHGSTLWGFPVLSLDDAIERGVEAVVLSANSIEDVLWEKTAWVRERGVEVVRLYGENR